MSNPFLEEEGPQPPRVLTAPLEVLANLRPLLENHIPLIIRFADRSQRFQSFVVELDRAGGSLVLDELIPTDGERLLHAGEPFSIEGFYEGARIAWEVRTARIDELDGIRSYRTELPTELVYHQRRNAYRATLTGPTVFATLAGKQLSQPLEGKVVDLSATGCKLCLPGNRVHGLQPGEVYEHFVAQLPIGRVETAIELRHARYEERSDSTFCGIRFHQMNGLLQRQIERLVYQLQREARRMAMEDRYI
ncbi:flagellar brake protein [Stutzerimonas azotifigens]|uniref:flagellar brake protein n=1 Tax=Stutzerimonas azotifigens TaxID=291995 RepID=UPI00042510A0|nr:flagellar brake protein [Stutzerimonas azotifigens]